MSQPPPQHDWQQTVELNPAQDMSLAAASETYTALSDVPEFGDNENEDENATTTIWESFIYRIPVIVEKLIKFGTLTDLHIYREISSHHNQLVSNSFFDHVLKTICIDTWRPEEGNIGDDRTQSQWKVKTFATYCKCDFCTVHDLLEINITSNNWTEQVAHIFRKLQVSDIWFNNMEINFNDGLILQTLIQQVRIHITELSLGCVPTVVDFEQPGEILSTFINQFENLETLFIDYKSATLAIPIMPVNQLETFIRNLNPNIQIDIQITENHEKVMNALGNSEKITKFTLFFEDFFTIQDLQFVVDKFGNLKNTWIRISNSIDVSSLVELQEFTTLTLQCKILAELGLNLYLDTFGDEDKESAQELMDKLSSRIHFLHLEQEHKKWDILNTPNGKYENLIGLYIYGYEHPLEILKHCHQLQILRLLGVDLEVCMLSNSQQSPEDNLKEYCSQLIHLSKFICHVNGKIRVMPPASYLENVLKGILPTNALIKLRYPKPESEAGPAEERDEEEEMEYEEGHDLIMPYYVPIIE